MKFESVADVIADSMLDDEVADEDEEWRLWSLEVTMYVEAVSPRIKDPVL